MSRADILLARTYCRPTEGGGLETWPQVVDRVIGHQKWLWVRAQGKNLLPPQEKELEALKRLMLERKVSLAGRTLWLGGTEVSQTRESSMFNCSALKLETIHDVVDMLWLLLNGCGVGFVMKTGTLNGFAKPINEIEVVRSRRTKKGGSDSNAESWDPDTRTWIIRVGDSAEGWAKSIGKLLAGKYPAVRLVFDLSQIRPSGGRLSRYGYISSGDSVLAEALPAIAKILNRCAGRLLTKIDLLDIGNWLGAIQTGRRGAEIALMRYGDPEWRNFAQAKKEYWLHGNEHRTQSNNSLMFYEKPTRSRLEEIFDIMQESGGSEPGFINAEAASRRAPYFSAVNPCGEILLGNKSFCNLVETDVSKFVDDPFGMLEAHYLVARANYRQTCVDLRDGVLQSAWHENNEFLRLCGVGLTGIIRRPDLTPYDFKALRNFAIKGAYSMSEDLGLPVPKNVTTIKPSGTLSKAVFDTTEGLHKPLGRYIFNNTNFSVHDPLVDKLEAAGYRVTRNPDQMDAALVTFPVAYEDVQFDIVDGKHVNLETAIDQLERYRMLVETYTENNASITVSYSPEEVPGIVDWIDRHWDTYLGVSFIYRNDPTKTARDLGYTYLPQEVVLEEDYKKYVETLDPVDLGEVDSQLEIDFDECDGGACPVR